MPHVKNFVLLRIQSGKFVLCNRYLGCAVLMFPIYFIVNFRNLRRAICKHSSQAQNGLDFLTLCVQIVVQYGNISLFMFIVRYFSINLSSAIVWCVHWICTYFCWITIVQCNLLPGFNRASTRDPATSNGLIWINWQFFNCKSNKQYFEIPEAISGNVKIKQPEAISTEFDI